MPKHLSESEKLPVSQCEVTSYSNLQIVTYNKYNPYKTKEPLSML